MVWFSFLFCYIHIVLSLVQEIALSKYHREKETLLKLLAYITNVEKKEVCDNGASD